MDPVEMGILDHNIEQVQLLIPWLSPVVSFLSSGRIVILVAMLASLVSSGASMPTLPQGRG